MVHNYIEKLVLLAADVRGQHDEVVWVHVLEEVHSARVVVVIAAHLRQFSSGIDPHLLIPLVCPRQQITHEIPFPAKNCQKSDNLALFGGFRRYRNRTFRSDPQYPRIMHIADPNTQLLP